MTRLSTMSGYRGRVWAKCEGREGRRGRTRPAYWPSEPMAIPFPPRQVMSFAKMFVEFCYREHNKSRDDCKNGCKCTYPFDG